MRASRTSLIPLARRIGEEAAVGAGVVLGALYMFARFGLTPWGRLFLFNGDSLLLPMVDRSIQRGEHFHWVFSAPLFFFPEGPIYWLCDLVSPSVQWALIVNGIVNVLIIYTLIRLIACRVQRNRLLSTISATALTLLIFVFIVAERDAQPQGGYASLLLFNTYYIGVVIVGLLTVFLVIRIDAAMPVRQQWPTVTGIGVVITAAAASDPLFIIQAVAPLLAALLVMTLVRNVPRFMGLVLVGVTGAATIAALVLRATVLKSLIVADVDGYVKGFDLGASMSALGDVVRAALHDPLQRVEIVIMIVGIVGSLGVAGWTLATRRGPIVRPSNALLVYFAAFSTPAILGSVVVSNNILTRYMIPLVLFPFLAYVPVVPRLLAVERTRHVVALALAVATVIVAIMGVRHVDDVRTFAAQQPAGAQCLATTLADNKAEFGVANYWRARALDVYSRRARILQVNLDFSPFLWLTNIGGYERKDFTFVLVDTPPPSPAESIPADDALGQLGAPSRQVSCGPFEIWFYDPSTPGHSILNQRIDDVVS